MDAVVAQDRVIHGDGTPEDAWRSWPRLANIPKLPVERLLPAAARLVVVAPHPDDEVLACGGLLALHVARGGEVLVAAVTDGEASHAGSPGCDAQQLAEMRRSERRAGLAHLAPLGGCRVQRLGLPDGAVHEQDVQALLEPLLRPGDCVVATSRIDGHPDHDATGWAAWHACTRVGCTLLEAPVWMWHWALPDDPRVPWQRLRRLALPGHLLACKQRALAQHVSQLGPRGAQQTPVLGAGILERLGRGHEYFFVAGPRTAPSAPPAPRAGGSSLRRLVNHDL